MATGKPSKGTPAAKTPATKPRRPPKQAPEAYYFTTAFKEVTGGRKPKKTIPFSACDLARDHGMDPETDRGATDIILDWEFSDPFWKDARKVRVPRRMRVLVPFGKYAKDPGHCFEIYDYEAKGKVSTLFELLQFCVERFSEHMDEYVDGSFCEGFEVYGDDLWVFWLNA